MKKSMLWGALLTLICSQLNAETTQPAGQAQTPDTTNGAVTTTNQPPVVDQNTPTTQTNQTNQQTQDAQPQTTQPVPTTNLQPSNEQVQPTQTVPVAQQAPPVINCDYKIPAETKTIDQSLVLTWSEKAVTQAFDFEPASFDAQLQKLQSCFTVPGWEGFSSALQKSGNIDAIKTQNLTVSSQLDGQAQVTEATANEWKVTLPLQVVYQNDKEKVTQLLNVNVTIGRKVSGDLGINQMVATPRVAVSTQPNNANAGVPTTPSATDSNTGAQNPTPNVDTSTPAATTTPSNSETQPTVIDNGSNQKNQNTGTTNPPGTPN